MFSCLLGLEKAQSCFGRRVRMGGICHLLFMLSNDISKGLMK
jgi:hypothetical protein